ncbi:NACHT domain-containing protein [Candidatus Magnetomoraceae bacterium gMMP-15]
MQEIDFITQFINYFKNALNDPKSLVPGIVVAAVGAALGVLLVWLFIQIKDQIIKATRKVKAWLGSIRYLQGLALDTYRKNVRDTYGKVKNIYLDKEELLDLHQVFVPLTLRNRPGKKIQFYKRKTREILTDPDQRRLVILAEPGSGKTTLLQALASGVSRRQWVEFKNLIPVFVRLRSFTAKQNPPNLYSLISKDILPEHGLHNHIPLLNSFLKEGKILLLLDGLDEVSDNDMKTVIQSIVKFLDKWDKKTQCCVFLTCREQNYNLLNDPSLFLRQGFEEYRLSDMRDSEMEEMISNRRQDFAEKNKSSENFLCAIRSQHNILSLHRNPLLLTISIALYLNRWEERVPHNLAEFYEESINHLLKRRDFADGKGKQNQFRAEEKYDFLQRFALNSMEKAVKQKRDFEEFAISEMTRLARRFAGERLNIRAEQAEDMVEEIHTKAGLIKDLGDKSHFVFAHRSFHEYCAAQRLKEMGDKGLKELLKNLQYSTWHQTAVFYASILHDNAEKLVTSLLNPSKKLTDNTDKISIIELTAKCASDLQRPLESLRLSVLEMLKKELELSSSNKRQRYINSLLILARNAPQKVYAEVERTIKACIHFENPEDFAQGLSSLEKDTALSLLGFMAGSNDLIQQRAALAGLAEMEGMEKMDVLWQLLGRFTNKNKTEADSARHQLFELIEKHEGAVIRLNNLRTQFTDIVEEETVRRVYPFFSENAPPDNFAYLLTLEAEVVNGK